MNRLLIIAALLLTCLLPEERLSLTEIEPVETLTVTKSDSIFLSTDTGSSGSGDTLQDAMAELHRTAVGKINLQTVDFLALDPECVPLLPELGSFLRPGTAVCLLEGNAEPQEIGSFLRIHKPKHSLLDAAQGTQLPILRIGEKMELETN